jgi:hypothetical protein
MADVAELEEEQIAAPEQVEDEAPAPEPEKAPEAEAEQDEPEEVSVTIGDEAEPEPEPERAPEWVRDLRKQHRELQRKVREYEEREKTQQVAPAAPVLGPKPKLEDHDYDTDRYETALESWYKQRDKVEAAKREQERQLTEQQKAWQAKLDNYAKAKTSLKVRDFDDAEMAIQDVFNVTQQGIVVQGADNPAMVVYALGKNPKRAKELAAISDPVQFAFAVAKLEQQLKVTPRAKPPAPEKSVPAGTAPMRSSDAQLERLREQAAKTGDLTPVIRYKQQLRAKEAGRR